MVRWVGGPGLLHGGLCCLWPWGQGLQKANGRSEVPEAKLFPRGTGGKAPGSLLGGRRSPDPRLPTLGPLLLPGKPAVGPHPVVLTVCTQVFLPLRQIPLQRPTCHVPPWCLGSPVPQGLWRWGAAAALPRQSPPSSPGRDPWAPPQEEPASAGHGRREDRPPCGLAPSADWPRRRLTLSFSGSALPPAAAGSVSSLTSCRKHGAAVDGQPKAWPSGGGG